MERVRRKKTAAERRAQRARAEGRRLQHVLLALNEVHSHRGGCLTKLGKAFKVALEGLDPANVWQQTQAAAQPEAAAPMSSPGSVGQTQAAAQPNNNAGPTDKRRSDLREAHGPIPSRPGGWPEKFVSGASAAAGGVAPEPLDRLSGIACGAAPHSPWRAAPMLSPVEQQTQAAAQPEVPAPMSSPGNVGQTQAAAQPNTSGVALEPLGSAFGAVPHSPRQAAPMQSSAFWAFGAAPHRSWQAAPMSSPTNVGQQTQAAAQPEAPAQISSPGNVGQKQAAAQPNTCGVAPEPLDRCSDTPFGAAQRSRKQLHQG